MCELASASDESAVDAVASSLAIEARPGVGLAERVADILAETDVVLLLDNCEHVHRADRRPRRACPRSRVPTSR